MKKVLILSVFLLVVSVAVAQNHAPVAVDDTITAYLWKELSYRVTANDYDPDGDHFRIYATTTSQPHTDTSIFFSLPIYYELNQDGFLIYNYYLVDEHGMHGPESFGTLYIKAEDPFYEYIEVNNVSARIHSYGNHFFNQMLPGLTYEFPKGHGDDIGFNTALWVGGVDEYGDTLVSAEVYHHNNQPLNFFSGPLSTDGNCYTNDSVRKKWRQIWKINKDDVLYHINHWSDPGYVIPEDIRNWPAHGDIDLLQSYFLAPFVDMNDNKIYEPHKGDFPLVRGDQSLFFVFNDALGQIGLEVHGYAWAFEGSGSPALANTIFFNYEVFNRSEKTLYNCYMGIHAEFIISSIPQHYFDFLASDVERGSFYVYSDVPQPGLGDTLKSHCTVMLGGPEMDADGLDNPSGECDMSLNGAGFGDGIVDNEKYGMTAFMTYSGPVTAPWTIPTEPQDYYHYLNNIWMDGSKLQYGGNGHFSSGAEGPECKFAYPGLSDPCNWGTNGIEPFGQKNWTDTINGGVNDYCAGLGIMGPFTFEAGTSQSVDFAFTSAWGFEEDPPVDKMLNYVDTVRALYHQDPDNFGFTWLDVPDHEYPSGDIRLFPNPARDILYLESSFTEELDYCIYDLSGRMLIMDKMPKHGNAINISYLKAGFYLLELKGEKLTFRERFIKKE